jgi:type II secretory pathway pseudopilin PulG
MNALGVLPPAGRTARRARSRGFALVEVMVSAAILIVGTLGLLSTIVASSKLEQSTAKFAVRARLVNQAIERLRNGSLVTRTQELVNQPKVVQDGQTATVQFPTTTLTRDLPTYSCATSPFLDVNLDGYLDVVAANAASPGLLPVRITVGTGNDAIVLETFVANR